MKNKYQKMTHEDFINNLIEVMEEEVKNMADLLTIPGVYEVVSEYFNNSVLDKWEEKQQEQ